MKDSIYLDASFLIALQVKEHPYYRQALSKADEIGQDELFISYLTLDELVYGLNKYTKDRRETFRIVAKNILGDIPIKMINIETGNSIALSYMRLWAKSKLAPRDAFHTFIMKQNGIKRIATFDSDFIKNQKQLGIQVV